MLRCSAALFLGLITVPFAFAQGIITTIAGTDWVFPADNKPARSAPLGRVAGVAFDRSGNLLIADPDNAQVFKVDSNGVLTIFAGNGFHGFSGDNGPATAASLDGPTGLTVDSAGNVYIADSSDNRVRKVSPTGIITTVAGTGYYGDSPDGGLAVQAALQSPAAVAVDRDNNLYIADSGGGRIRKVTADGKIAALPGATKLDYPTDIVFDSAGNLYIAEYGTRLIRKLDPSGKLTTYAGTGEYLPPSSGVPALTAALGTPARLAIDASGALYLSDERNDIVQRIDVNGVITTIAGSVLQANFFGDTGSPLKAAFNTPRGIAVDSSGAVYIADALNQRVRKFTASAIDTYAGNAAYRFGGDNGPAIAALFSQPTGIALDSSGNLYIVDTLGNRVRRVTPKGIISTFAGTGDRGYSGDNGPATAARLYEPSAVAIDSSGNVYISDPGNHLIRRVRPDGVITTFAGTGTSGYDGENIPALQSRINYPAGLAFDSKGNLYFADDGGFRVRKITPAGIMSTYAGSGATSDNGQPLGDGGPATKAVLGYLDGIAIDPAGNLYVSEKYVGRVRKVDPAGIITIYAGLADAPSLGDGGLATKASVGPRGLAIDPAGNLLIADQGNGLIRRVSSATGIITTIAGNPNKSFSGDGGSAVLAGLDGPTAVITDSAGNLYIADTRDYRIREVTNVQPPFTVSSDSLTFTAPSGGPPPIEQQLLVSSTIVNTAFTTSASANWLTVAPDIGLMPGVIQVIADPTNLAVGTYDARITVTAPTATPPARVVAVQFQVTPAPDPKLTTDYDRLDFTRVQGATPDTQSFRVLNNGSGTLDFTVAFSTTSGGSWLQVTPASGSANANAPVRLAATANPAGLAAGTYAGLITITAPKANQRVLVPVAMTVNSSTQNMVLSQTGVTFTIVSGGPAPPGQQIGVLNTGLGSMNWTASASTASSGSWLNIAPTSGASGAAGSNIGYVQVEVNPAGLTTGEYYGRVTITAPGAPNSPQSASVVLRILPPGTTTPPDVRPTGFIFVAPPGAPPPPTQTVLLTNLGTTPLTFVSTAKSPPFTYAPVTGALNPGEPARVLIQANAGQTPGIRRGTITFQFSDGSVRPVDVLVAIPPSGASAETAKAPEPAGMPLRVTQGDENARGYPWRGPVVRRAGPRPALVATMSDGPNAGQSAGAADHGSAPQAPNPAAGSCVPRSLNPVFTLLGQQFVVAAAWPSPVEVRVVDDCGEFLNSGSVTLTFSSLDAPVTMVSIGDGRWSGTWQPRANASQVRITATAETADSTLRGAAQITGGVNANAAIPVIPPGSVVNAASFAAGAPIAPGSLISIFGSRLAASPSSTAPPLPIKLGSTLVDLGGVALPLYYVSEQQINAIVPYGLPVNTRLEIVVQRDTQITVPQFVTMAPAQPAVFTYDGSGSGQGDILDVNGALVDRAHPARPGDTVVIYCAGLGPVDQSISVTQPTPDSPLSHTVSPVTVAIGGKPATVAFAGLTPRYTGLYQINAVVPDGVAPGDDVEVIISVAGQVSPAVTMAVQ